jgi:hypothetical protein
MSSAASIAQLLAWRRSSRDLEPYRHRARHALGSVCSGERRGYGGVYGVRFDPRRRRWSKLSERLHY